MSPSSRPPLDSFFETGPPPRRTRPPLESFFDAPSPGPGEVSILEEEIDPRTKKPVSQSPVMINTRNIRPTPALEPEPDLLTHAGRSLHRGALNAAKSMASGAQALTAPGAGDPMAAPIAPATGAVAAPDVNRFRDWAGRAASAIPTSGPQKFTEIEGLEDFVRYGSRVFLENMPQMGATIIGGAAGGPVGAGLASYLMNTGEVYDNLLEKGHDRAGVAAAMGIPIAALDVIEPLNILRKSNPDLAAGVMERIAQGAFKGSLTETPTEGAQEALAIGAEKFVTGEPWKREDTERVGEAMVAGAFVGGGMGGVAAIPKPRKELPNEDVADTGAAPLAPVEPPASMTVAPSAPASPDSIYDRAKVDARGWGSFGRLKIAKQYGLTLDQANEVIARLVKDGLAFERTNQDGRKWYSNKPARTPAVQPVAPPVEQSSAPVVAPPADPTIVEPPTEVIEPPVSAPPVAPLPGPEVPTQEFNPLPQAFRNQVGEYQLIDSDGHNVNYSFIRMDGRAVTQRMPEMTWRNLASKGTPVEKLEAPAPIEQVPQPMEAPAPIEPVSPSPAITQEPGGRGVETSGEATVSSPVREPKHKFGTTQVNLQGASAGAIRSFASVIPDTELAADGRETEPHVTVKYGLKATGPEQIEAIRQALSSEPPIQATLGKTSLFQNEDADVLKVDVESPDLHRINAKIREIVPTEDTHPTYIPHVTIAFLKPGEGRKYDGMQEFAGQGLTFSEIVISDRDGNQIPIPLGGIKPGREEVVQQQPEVQPARESESPAAPAGDLASAAGMTADDLVAQVTKRLQEERAPKPTPAPRKKAGTPPRRTMLFPEGEPDYVEPIETPAPRPQPVTTAPTAPSAPQEQFQPGDLIEDSVTGQVRLVSSVSGGRAMTTMPSGLAVGDSTEERLRGFGWKKVASVTETSFSPQQIQQMKRMVDEDPRLRSMGDRITLYEQNPSPENFWQVIADYKRLVIPLLGQAPAAAKTSTSTPLDSAADEARKRLRQRLLGQKLSSGLDPEILTDLATIGARHMLAGAIQFRAWAAKMGEDVGDILQAVAELTGQTSEAVLRQIHGYASRVAQNFGVTAEAIEELENGSVLGVPGREPGDEGSDRADDPGQGISSEVRLDDPLPEGSSGTEAPGRAGRSGSRRGGPRPRGSGAMPHEGDAVPSGAGVGATGVVPAAEHVDGTGDDEGGATDAVEAPVPSGSGTANAGKPPRSGSDRSGRGVPERDAAKSGQGTPVESGPRDSDDSLRSPVEPPRNNIASPRLERDYRIPDDRRVTATPERAAENNIAAIRLLRTLEQEDRFPNGGEKDTLAGYIGWGNVPQIFAAQTAYWRDRQAELKGLLSDEEYANASRSTTNAHYTSDAVVDAVWSALQHVGVKPGMAYLEPAVGSGNFFGRMPSELLDGTRRIGIDKDTITSKITQKLYPDSAVEIKGYEEAELPDNFFDFVVSNVPFGDFGVHDPNFRGKDFLTNPIHNYFFARALRNVRPGGVIAFITSRYTMDAYSPGHKKFREWVSRQANFLGAVRLPDTAFQKTAGTSVVTDVIFLRKLLPNEERSGPSWDEVEGKSLPEKSGWRRTVPVNLYYHENPGNILGEESLAGTQYSGSDYTVSGKVTGEEIAAKLKKILPADALREFTPAQPSPRRRAGDVKGAEEAKVGALFFNEKGDLFRRATRGSVEPVPAGAKVKARIRGQLEIRDRLNELLAAERANDEPRIASARAALNEAYDRFVAEMGPLSSRSNFAPLSADPDAPLLLALEQNWDPEKKTAEKASIFTTRLDLAHGKVASADTPKDALVISLSELGRIDWERMTELTGRSEDDLRNDLSGQGLIFQDPITKQWELADEYLSGPVRSKLRDARGAAKVDKRYEANVKALEAVQPTDLPRSRIRLSLGMQWIPTAIYQKFLQDILQLADPPGIVYLPADARWIVDAYKVTSPSVSTWRIDSHLGGVRVSEKDIIQAALNKTRIKVYDKTPDGTEVNPALTALANEKVDQLKAKFEEWAWATPEREAELVRMFNDTNFDLRRRQYDGSHLQFEGMNRATLRGGRLADYQLAAVWRMITQRVSLIAHTMGAGKTFELIAAGMEMKRMGLVKRPMYVVPNSTLGGWQAQFNALYPGKRVLVFGPDDFEAKRRRQLMSQIAIGNWDAVVVPHSSFLKLPVSDALFKEHYDRLAKELEEQILEAEEAGMHTRMIKRMEKAKERLLTKLQKRRAENTKDNTVFWEDLGIDQIFLDESHFFKKLGFATKQGNVAGIDQAGNQKTFDLLMKMRHTQRHGRGVVFATGTPITNTMGEMFTIFRYLIEDEMKARGMGHFDQWAENFGRAVPSFEPKPEGGGYQSKMRFAKFVNLQPLLSIWSSIADVVTRDMLPDLGLPKEARRTVVATMDEQQATFMESLQRRARRVRADPRGAMPDNMLSIYGDAQAMALDIRMVDPVGQDRGDSRLASAVDNIVEQYAASMERRGVQLVFADSGVPLHARPKKKKRAKNRTDFSVYDELIRKLIDRGIPREEIATVYDFNDSDDDARSRLFLKARRGEVRVLMGSTDKLGVGVNVQDRVVAMHHLDLPARPDQFDQREARGIRQGNQNDEVTIYTYVTKGSGDELKSSALARKSKFIWAVLAAKADIDEMEDVDVPMTFEMFQAAASGNPLVLEKFEVDAEVAKLSMLRMGWADERERIRSNAAQIPRRLDWERNHLANLEAAITARDTTPDDQYWVIAGQAYPKGTSTDEIAAALDDAVKDIGADDKDHAIGTHRGQILTARGKDQLEMRDGKATTASHITFNLQHGNLSLGSSQYNPDSGRLGQVSSVAYYARHLDNRLKDSRRELEELVAKAKNYQSELGKPWPYEEDLAKAFTRQREIFEALGGGKGDTGADVIDEIVDDSVEAQKSENDDDEEGAGAEENEDQIAPPGTGFLGSDYIRYYFEKLLQWIEDRRAAPDIDPVLSLFEEPERRLQSAKVQKQTTMSERLKEAAIEFKNKFGRTYHLLDPKIYGDLIFHLKQLEKSVGLAAHKATEAIIGILSKMQPNEFDLFMKVVVTGDLLETLERFEKQGKTWEEMPFGYTPDTLRADVRHFTAAAQGNEAIQKAMDARRRLWDFVKSGYIHWMKEAGYGRDLDETLDRQNYFHHRVLAHIAEEGGKGTGKKLRAPFHAGYLKERQIHALDWSTDYIVSEFEVLQRMLADTATARVVAFVNNNLDQLPRLKSVARSRNKAAVMPHFERMAAARRMAGEDVTAEQLYRRVLNWRQAKAMKDFGRAAAGGLLPLGDKNQWAGFADNLAIDYLEMLDSLSEDGSGQFRSDMKTAIRYSSWVLTNADPNIYPEAVAAASMLLKGIKLKQDTIRKLAGNAYIDTKNAMEVIEKVGDGAVAWQPDQGNTLYLGYTIPEQIAVKMVEEMGKAFGITAADLRRVRILGGRKRVVALAPEVATTLDNIKKANETGPIARAWKSAMVKMKQLLLVSPLRAARYIIRNLSGDSEATAIGNWRAFRRLRTAVVEIAGYMRNGATTETLQRWLDRGGMESIYQVQEATDVKTLDNLAHLLDPIHYQGDPWGPIKRSWQMFIAPGQKVATYAEALLRYANFIEFAAQIEAAGGRVSNYGASIPESVDALTDTYDKAYRLSNDLMGAYDEISEAGRWLRNWPMIFWSFQEINFRRYWRLMRNAYRSDRTAAAAGYAVLGTGRAAFGTAVRVGQFAIAAAALKTALTVFNYLMFPDEEEELDDSVRSKAHIILGRKPDGKIRTFNNLGLLDDLLEWAGLHGALTVHLRRYMNGQATLQEVAKEIAKGPFNKIAGGLSPQMKLPAELLTGKTIYPDVFNPRDIHDRGEYLVRMLGPAAVTAYKKAMGKPTEPMSLDKLAASLLWYENDPDQIAYFDARETRTRKDERRQLQDTRSKALYEMRMHLRYGDSEGVNRSIEEYFAAGGTVRGVVQSAQRQHPLYGMKPAERKKYIASLSAPDRDDLQRAVRFWDTHLKADPLRSRAEKIWRRKPRRTTAAKGK